MKNDPTLWLVWQNPKSRLYYHIGTLTFSDGSFHFSYTNGSNERKLSEAVQDGYMIHPAFPEAHKKYTSKSLFSAFDRRIPSPDRVDYADILKDLGLPPSPTKMDLLEATRGRLANDTYSFERPLRYEADGTAHTSFFIHGMRYQNLPSDWHQSLQIDDQVILKREPENPRDPNAVAIFTKGGTQIGYVPGFYAKGIGELLQGSAEVTSRIVYVNEKSTPDWWVKVDVVIDPIHYKDVHQGEVMAITQIS